MIAPKTKNIIFFIFKHVKTELKSTDRQMLGFHEAVSQIDTFSFSTLSEFYTKQACHFCKTNQTKAYDMITIGCYPLWKLQVAKL